MALALQEVSFPLLVTSETVGGDLSVEVAFVMWSVL